VKIHDFSPVDLGIELKVELENSLISTKVGSCDRGFTFFHDPSIDLILGKNEEQVGVAHLGLNRFVDSELEVFCE
jgi:hypothetical protein